MGALFRACRWLPLAVSSGWVGRKITSSHEDSNPVLGTPPSRPYHPPKTLLLRTIPLGLGFSVNLGAGDTSMIHSRSLATRGQGPPAPGPERARLEGGPASQSLALGGGQRAVGGVCSHSSPRFLGPVWEQVQLPGVAGAWVGASAAECGRAPPLPAEMSTCQAPGAADVLVAPSAARLTAGCPGPAAGGPEMSGQLPCRGGAPGGGESEAPPGPGMTLLRIAPWARIPRTFKLSSSPPPRALPSHIPRDNRDGGAQRGRTWPSLCAAWWLLSWDPSPAVFPPVRPPCSAQGSANWGQSWRCLRF